MINGSKGKLEYRGYDIEDLVENSTFLEVSYLLIYGELPNAPQLSTWQTKIMNHTFIHEDLLEQMRGFRYDAHPMGMLISSIASLGTFYSDANPALQGTDIYKKNIALRNKQIFRILGKLPTIAACAYRHRIGRPYNMPVNDLSYTENFLYMLDRLNETHYKPHPVLAKALEKLWIIHAEHGLNCSTATMRQLVSTNVDPYSAVAGSAAALYGPLHGGANEAVLRMLKAIGSKENVPSFLEDVKQKKQRLMGFGHRVYKSYDPRAKILKNIANDVFDLLGPNPLMEVAIELEKCALNDDYFISRKLYPNLDFYSGLIYNAMGFPTDMFPVLFTIPRAAGWLAHWVEFVESDASESKIFRPKQIYSGPELREYDWVEDRSTEESVLDETNLQSYKSTLDKRRQISTTSLSSLEHEVFNIPKTAGKQRN